ncbi:MAG: hypothetical protein KF784_09005 [Fimbriimonadaceae bacterium]|nr:hypothetical protein [Fimbriimonadaceae bacterium]
MNTREIRLIKPDGKPGDSGELIARITFKDSGFNEVNAVLPVKPMDGSVDPRLAENIFAMYQWMSAEMSTQHKYEVEYFGSAITPLPAKPDGRFSLNLIREADGTYSVK